MQRMAGLSIRLGQDYLQRLDAAELDALTSHTTVSESWFFRDPGQMRLLQHLLLPALIKERRIERRLRLWSAGCSTGQEPWSLAMLLAEVVPDPAGWDIRILGSDIDSEALAVAEAGRYRGWAMRGLSQTSRSRHFVKRGEHWQIGDGLRRLVHFQHDNLTGTDAPPIMDVDLVLCRNVLIYIQRDRLAQVVSRVGKAVREGGLLIAGHCELIDVATDGFEVERFPETLVYRRRRSTASAPDLPDPARSAAATPARKATRSRTGRATTAGVRSSDRWIEHRPATRTRRRGLEATLPTATPGNPATPLSNAPRSTTRGDSLGVPGTAQSTRQGRDSGTIVTSDTVEALIGRAAQAAERGDYATATNAAMRARQLTPVDYRPVYLLAQLAELQDDHVEAQRLLAAVLYLAPEFIPAYLDAAAQSDRLKQAASALRHRRAARRLLSQLPPDEALSPPYQHLSVAMLADYLDELLSEPKAEDMIGGDAEDASVTQAAPAPPGLPD